MHRSWSGETVGLCTIGYRISVRINWLKHVGVMKFNDAIVTVELLYPEQALYGTAGVKQQSKVAFIT